MRGALRSAVLCSQGPRIIPADAGSTMLIIKDPGPGEDHPRGCGEHGFGGPVGHPVEGSSPRMRGAQEIITMTDTTTGIIPADAGST